MTTQLEGRNKALVLEAFETLFNKRDYDAAARFWSPNYIQHSAHIAPGREGLFNLIKSMPPTLEYEPGKEDDKTEYKQFGALLRNKPAEEEIPLVILHPKNWKAG